MTTVLIHSRVCLMLIGLAAADVQAQEIHLPFQEIVLGAELVLAEGRSLTDGVIVMVHGGLAHRGTETMVQLQSMLKARGFNSLAITLSLGVSLRLGMYDCAQIHRHRQDDALVEVAAWLNWLSDQGAAPLILLGHSRGGAQVARYIKQAKLPQVRAAILLAPATAQNNDAASYLQRYSESLVPILLKARSLVSTGQGQALLAPVNLMSCRFTTASADSVLSYYGDPLRYDTPTLVTEPRVPTLVVVAGNDTVVKGLPEKLAPLLEAPLLQMMIVEGGDHFFRDLDAEDAADAITDFLHALPP